MSIADCDLWQVDKLAAEVIWREANCMAEESEKMYALLQVNPHKSSLLDVRNYCGVNYWK